jgi:hypothetical protein
MVNMLQLAWLDNFFCLAWFCDLFVTILYSCSNCMQTSLPVEDITKALAKMGYEVMTSDDAGRFVCNYVYYHSLRFAEQNGTKSLFVHVPLFLTIDEETQMQFAAALLEVLASLISSTHNLMCRSSCACSDVCHFCKGGWMHFYWNAFINSKCVLMAKWLYGRCTWCILINAFKRVLATRWNLVAICEWTAGLLKYSLPIIYLYILPFNNLLK